jgi:hypothetical protein
MFYFQTQQNWRAIYWSLRQIWIVILAPEFSDSEKENDRENEKDFDEETI